MTKNTLQIKIAQQLKKQTQHWQKHKCIVLAESESIFDFFYLILNTKSNTYSLIISICNQIINKKIYEILKLNIIKFRIKYTVFNIFLINYALQILIIALPLTQFILIIQTIIAVLFMQNFQLNQTSFQLSEHSSFQKKDNSNIDKQPRTLNYADLDQVIKQLSKVKYPITAVKSVTKIDDILQKKYFQQINMKEFKQLLNQQKLKYYREIRGDGNCLIRAVAFEYISYLETTNFEQYFKFLQQVQLTCSSKQHIPRPFLPFYQDKLLFYALTSNWQKLYNKHLQNTKNNNYELALANLLAQNPYLDFIMILYFRAVCLLSFNQLRQEDQISDFLANVQEKNISNYSQQSESLIAYFLCSILKLQINIFQIRKNEFKKYSYKPKKGINLIPINLLYWNDHYDLLEQNAKIQEEVTDTKLNKVSSYYSLNEQNQRLIQTICEKCQKKVIIPIQQLYCEKCELQLKAFHRKVKVQEQKQKNILDPKRKQVNQKQNLPKISEKDKQSKTLKLECLSCHKIQYVNEFRLCWRCSENQKATLKKEQKTQKCWLPMCFRPHKNQQKNKNGNIRH